MHNTYLNVEIRLLVFETWVSNLGITTEISSMLAIVIHKEIAKTEVSFLAF